VYHYKTFPYICNWEQEAEAYLMLLIGGFYYCTVDGSALCTLLQPSLCARVVVAVTAGFGLSGFAGCIDDGVFKKNLDMMLFDMCAPVTLDGCVP
jgi:hypothetical protein